MNVTWTPSRISAEHDACGLWGWVNRDGRPSYAPIRQACQALDEMSHRAGSIDGEGDGAGLLTDIPRALWATWVGDVAYAPDFGVAHLLVPETTSAATLRARVAALGLTVLKVQPGRVDPAALGPLAAQERLTFWQIAFQGPVTAGVLRGVWDWERDGLAVLSFSHHTVVYKLRGHGRDLPRYFLDLDDPAFLTVSAIGHVRYSTNTTTRAERAQPFRILGHNGEINTIARLRKLSDELGWPLPDGGSDSQDLSRLVEALIVEQGLTLAEALGLLFPPVPSVVNTFAETERQAWHRLRETVGPVAQGPAAILARYGATLMATQDQLGLRPLWWLEAEEGIALASEPGAVPLNLLAPPSPLGPGEKALVSWEDGRVTVLRSPELEHRIAEQLVSRFPTAEPVAPVPYLPPARVETPLGAWAYEQIDVEILEAMARGQDPIGSLGWDGPLGALDPQGGPLADYLQETVAVVTNPAIDRERERAHFSTEVFLGPRPWVNRPATPGVRHTTPLFVDQWDDGSPPPDVAVLAAVPLRVTRLAAWVPDPSGVRATLDALAKAALDAVAGGTTLLVLDDAPAEDGGPLDPVLMAAYVARALEQARTDGISWRRQVALVVRSGLLRRLHDIVAVLGVGADAVVPYRLWDAAYEQGGVEAVGQVAKVLRQGIEKVLSTVGIHELRGYGPLFGAIGLTEELAEWLEVPLMVPGTLTPEILSDHLARQWASKAVRRPYHLYPKVYKAAQTAAAQGRADEYAAKLAELEQAQPIALRHLLEVRPAAQPSPSPVNLSIGRHRLPFVIGSMSFGSQGETAFRAYLKAAAHAGMIAMNGEGGEILDLVPYWREHRGIQIASGRFGITAEIVGTARYLEIKIGQGAKPGEGGHLPARKVTPQVAAARRSPVGVDLISPSNNHDLYSIEDLAELIYELKTVSPDAQVAVKVPVVPNLGTIAVGIAKAGADIINISGFEGGTGAARRHALRHVGLPSDLGTVLVHRSLVAAGLRHQVEIWADGGMRSPDDVIKLVLLGANRIGFGTLAMVAAGCTICRACHLDTCHVGIATQIRSVEEAQRHGLKRFVPRDLDLAAEAIANFFTALGDAVAAKAATLGVHRLQDLVGLASHLEQARGQDRVDLSSWCVDVPVPRRLPVTVMPPDAPRRVLQVARAGTQVRDVEGNLALEEEPAVEPAVLTWEGIAGQGLAAFHTAGMVTRVKGGAQDGVAKGMSGGEVLVVGGVGKSLAYGATGGKLFVTGPADTRACVRLSGGEVVLGAWPEHPVDGSMARAALKGYAFEYMTGGLVVTLGDPGPWICAGMTGGVVVALLHPDLGLTREYLESRLAPGAAIRVQTPPSDKVWHQTRAVLHRYIQALRDVGEVAEAERVESVLDHPERFVALHPAHEQADPSVSTE